jgi:tellurite resistance protein TehA-like permease
MKSDAPARGQGAAELPSRHPPFGLLRELERPGDFVRDLGPNWYASVMGTGIVAIAGAGLPFRVPGLHVFATVMWALAAAALLALITAWAVRWTRFPDRVRAEAGNPVAAQFWGAPAMALMTVGTATLILGPGLIGQAAAVGADWAVWAAGTALGLVTAAWIPYLTFTRYKISPDAAFGGWLMPVVPPMVSAANGALLIPYAAPGQGRLTLLLGCYAMFGISLFASVVIITQIWSRLAHYKIGPAVMVPTLWIVLGPLGQSVTATGNLGNQAATVLRAPYAAITVRTIRRRLPFTLTWWSFTFPVGTCVTGTIALAARSDAVALRWATVPLYLLLLGAWLVVAVNTARGSATGRLFRPASPAEPGPQSS